MRYFTLFAGASLLVLSSQAAFAQATTEETTSSASADEIVVTAQHREERSQDVGIAIAAYSGDTLRERGITSSLEIAKLTPGVNLSGTLGGQGLQFSIRGVTQSDYNDAIEAPVAVYVDDSYISSQQAQGMALFDIERVEALKGPQGTLFGRNATGGLVHFVINKPRLGETSGHFDATYGSFDATVLEGAINLPLGDKAALRVSGTWNRHGSIWRNVFPGGMVAGAPLNFGPQGVSPSGQDLGSEDALAGRVQLLVEPSDSLTIRLSGSAFRQDLSESPWTSSAVAPVIDAQNRTVGSVYLGPNDTFAAIGPNGQNFFNPAVLPFQGFMFSPGNNGRRAPGASWFGYVPVSANDRLLSKDFARSDLNRFRAYNAALHIDADLGGVQFASISSYSKYNKHFLLDADGSPANGFVFGTRANTRTFSQELRFSGDSDTVKWQAGAYYLDIDAHVNTGLLAPRGSALAAVFGATATGIDPEADFTLKTKSASLFGQASWEFAPTFTLVVGGRIIREKQTYRYDSYATANLNDYAVDIGSPLFPLYPTFTDEQSRTLWAGKAQLEYRPNGGLLVYAGVNRGVKGGSYNGKLFDGTAPLAPSAIPYRPEVLTSYEGGFKLTGGSYTLNASVFHYRYHDYQSFVFTDISGFVQNANARSTGVEVEATVRFGDLKLGGNAAYIDARVNNLEIAPGVFRDTRPTYTPKWSASAYANYTVPTAVLGGKLSLGAQLSYQSDFYHNARNFDAHLFESRTLVDINTSIEFDNGLSIGGFVKNLFDVRYRSVGLDLATGCGCNLEAYGMPRTWGVKVGYEF